MRRGSARGGRTGSRYSARVSPWTPLASARGGEAASGGFALIYAVMVVAVVGGLIFGVTQFRSMVTHATELAAQEVNAHAAAEAGQVAAVAELQADALFRTHTFADLTNAPELARDPLATPKLAFGKPLEFSSRVAAALPKYSGLEREGTGGPGDYTFHVGRGLGPTVGRGYDGTFRVKVAPCVLSGYPRPLVAVESRGRFDQRVVALVTFLEAGGAQAVAGAPVLDLKHPSLSSLLNDYLLVDGEVLDPALGHAEASQDQLVLSVGKLYGGQGVALAGAGPAGTRLGLRRLGGIRSGGGVWLADPLDITFHDPARPGEASAVFRAPGGDRPDPQAPASDLFEATGGRVADHRHGGKLALPDLASCLDRLALDRSDPHLVDLTLVATAGAPDDSEAYEGGAFIRRISNYSNPFGSAGDTIELCFGRPSYMEGVTGDADPIAYTDAEVVPALPTDHPAKTAKPAAFLFAKGFNLVVWGCPDRDVAIYTDRDLYVAGDFNQSPWHHQTYTSQDPASARALDEDGRATRYLDPVRFAGSSELESGTLDDQEAAREGSAPGAARLDRKGNTGLFQERKLARLTAHGRVWLDHRYPGRVLANELLPWLAYQLAAHLGTDPASAPTGAPSAAALSAALAGSRYPSLADLSRRDRAVTLNLPGPLFGLRDAAGNATPVLARFVKDVLFLDPGSPDPVVREGAGKATALLRAELGVGPSAAKVYPAAERLFYKVLTPLEKRTQAGGLWRIPQAYHDQVFVGGAADPSLDRHVPALAAQGDPRTLRFYLPEMTVNATLVDGAVRHGDWDRSGPRAAKKVLSEIGNAPATGVYLRHRERGAGFAPLISRVYGAQVHLRQVQPDPALFLSADTRASTPPVRRRVFARSQGRWIGASLRFGLAGDAGLPCVYRVVSRRESVLAAERGAADQLLEKWP